MRTGSLYWNTGIGWYSIITAGILTFFSTVTNGVLHWILLSVMILWILLIIMRAYRWNGSPWRRIHYRAMYLWSHFAGEEAGRAATEKREYDRGNPCLKLLYMFIEDQDFETAIEMFQTIGEERGNLYVAMLDTYIRYFHPKASEEAINDVLEALANERELNPRMAIACLILNKYGEREAAKYVMAIVEGHAN